MILFWLPVLFYSCSETSSLEEGQYLYNGATIKIKADPPLKHSVSKNLKPELNGLLRPKPNGSFLGVRVKLLVIQHGRKAQAAKGLQVFDPQKTRASRPRVGNLYCAMEKNRAVLAESAWRTVDYFQGHGYSGHRSTKEGNSARFIRRGYREAIYHPEC